MTSRCAAAALVLSLLVLSTADYSHSEDPQGITVKSGEDVTLQCRGPADASIALIVWKRSDLKTNKYVFFFKEEQPNENYQLPSFHGRVELSDPEMKDGDASVILRNVNVNDSGTYECEVSTGRKTPELVGSIDLQVKDSDEFVESVSESVVLPEGNQEASVGVGAAPSLHTVLLVLLIICVGFMIRRKCRRRSHPVI